jgi:maleylacetoacetate isomerase
MTTLYNYHRSSVAYRVRIALNLKGIDYKMANINLLEAEEQGEDYLKINPQGLVPSLLDDGAIITQSLAIVEYLDEKYSDNPLLPSKPIERALVRSLANIIACDIHPLDNLRVLKYLVNELDVLEEDKMVWYRHWITKGFDAFETQLKETSNGQFCFSESATIADAFLIPQVYNANRFKVDMSKYPLISSINDHCLTLPAFDKAVPENL